MDDGRWVLSLVVALGFLVSRFSTGLIRCGTKLGPVTGMREVVNISIASASFVNQWFGN
jgi:hypothetical protein